MGNDCLMKITDDEMPNLAQILIKPYLYMADKYGEKLTSEPRHVDSPFWAG